MTDGYLLGPHARKDLAYLRHRFVKRLPDAGQPRHRRDHSNSITTQTGGGNGGGGNAGCCCNSANCQDLCDANESDVVTNCGNCPSGALRYYTAELGSLLDDPTTGYTKFTADELESCKWVSANISVSGGTYRAYHFKNSSSSTIWVEWISGSDPLKLNDGYHQLKWKFNGVDEDWSCLCNMQFKLTTPDRIYKPSGLNSLVCLVPRLGIHEPSDCPKVEGIVPCVEPVQFPSITFLFDQENPHHWATNTGESVDGAEAMTFPYGFEGDTGDQVIPMSPLLTDCSWAGGVETVPPEPPVSSNGILIGGHGGVHYSVIVNYAAGTASFTFYSYQGQVDATYFLDPAAWVLGENTLTLQAQDGEDVATYPETIIIVLSDCRYSSSHPDYGYGCGGTGGGESGCGGFGCQYSAMDSNGVQGGPDGPWTWMDCGPGACPEGCTLPGPPMEPPTSGGDTFSVSCVAA